MTTSVSTDTTSVIVAETCSAHERNKRSGASCLPNQTHAREQVCVSVYLCCHCAFSAGLWDRPLLGSDFIQPWRPINSGLVGSGRLAIGNAPYQSKPASSAVAGDRILGLVQLLPLRHTSAGSLSTGVTQALSLDPNATRLVLIQISTLLVYFGATLVFIDTPRRLQVLVRTILNLRILFGPVWFNSINYQSK